MNASQILPIVQILNVGMQVLDAFHRGALSPEEMEQALADIHDRSLSARQRWEQAKAAADAREAEDGQPG